jgi:predicted unusual protein kinase regulating ubiquinone biosynthesis (AarF/ABC1/UbiB family)
MAADDRQERLKQFLDSLRSESGHSRPVSGLGRIARTVRGAIGIASGVWSARRWRGELDDGDLDSIEQLVTRLGELKGLPMKIGQILGYLDLELPEQMRQLLALLQTQSPATPFEQVRAILRADLGKRGETLLGSMSPSPVSAASIGQVHRSSLPRGPDVAVKVLHPGIEAAIRSDFSGALAGTAFAALLMPGAGRNAREFVEEARSRLLEECDYRLEADRQELFGRLFEQHPSLLVPRVHRDYCGTRVLTSTWMDGRDFAEFADHASQTERDLAGRALFELYVGTLYRHGLFHADPHPGNYRFGPDGRVVVFDYGCVRVLERPLVEAFVALTDAVRRDDEDGIRAALSSLGAAPPQDQAAFAHIRSLLRKFFGPMLEVGPRRIDGTLIIDARRITRDKRAMVRLRLPASLLFLFRIRFGLYSVIARLGSVADWSALERAYADCAARLSAEGHCGASRIRTD